MLISAWQRPVFDRLDPGAWRNSAAVARRGPLENWHQLTRTVANEGIVWTLVATQAVECPRRRPSPRSLDRNRNQL